MATYAIGDIQGCYDPFMQLLEKIQFNEHSDQLWLTGDLVNRGPNSIEVLRLVKSLGAAVITVLGNHDLALLALNVGAIEPKDKDTFDSVLKAPDCEELLAWLKAQPILHVDSTSQTALAHAGIFPLWTLEQASNLAEELHQVLVSSQCNEFLHNMFGKKPAYWSEDLQRYDRLRFITNAFTRMRYCCLDGKLNLKVKGPVNKAPPECIPWFAYPNPAWQGTHIIFGHWASLKGRCEVPNIDALDTGCVWGRCLTALCLETRARFQIDCSK